MYRKFRDDPSSVDPSWHEFLVDYNPEPTTEAAPSTGDGHAAAPQATKATAAQPPAAAPSPPAQTPAAVGNGAPAPATAGV